MGDAPDVSESTLALLSDMQAAMAQQLDNECRMPNITDFDSATFVLEADDDGEEGEGEGEGEGAGEGAGESERAKARREAEEALFRVLNNVQQLMVAKVNFMLTELRQALLCRATAPAALRILLCAVLPARPPLDLPGMSDVALPPLPAPLRRAELRQALAEREPAEGENVIALCKTCVNVSEQAALPLPARIDALRVAGALLYMAEQMFPEQTPMEVGSHSDQQQGEKRRSPRDSGRTTVLTSDPDARMLPCGSCRRRCTHSFMGDHMFVETPFIDCFSACFSLDGAAAGLANGGAVEERRYHRPPLTVAGPVQHLQSVYSLHSGRPQRPRAT